MKRLVSMAFAAVLPFLGVASAADAAIEQRTAVLIDLAVRDLVANGSEPRDFRDVRAGTFISRDKSEKLLLCGDVEIVPAGQEAVWAAFAVIETDPYELLLGGNATGTCSGDHVTWLAVDDLAPVFDERLKEVGTTKAE
ncbi:MAG: hypothetical protein QM698_14035 [Micropepsaceae bacterium]